MLLLLLLVVTAGLLSGPVWGDTPLSHDPNLPPELLQAVPQEILKAAAGLEQAHPPASPSAEKTDQIKGIGRGRDGAGELQPGRIFGNLWGRRSAGGEPLQHTAGRLGRRSRCGSRRSRGCQRSRRGGRRPLFRRSRPWLERAAQLGATTDSTGTSRQSVSTGAEAASRQLEEYYTPEGCAVKLKNRDCITYQAIEEAFQEARKHVELNKPEGEWQPEHVATVGDLLLKTAQNVARRYKLSPHEVERVLPKANTLRTSIAEVCPDYASPIQCRPKKYRRIDGLCNNLRYPNWGATRRVFQRLLEPHYADGIDAPRGGRLPSPRLVSAAVHIDKDLFDHAATLMLIAWGQFMDHDFTLTFTRPADRTRNEPEDCCHRSGPEDCLPITIRPDDPFFGRRGVDCIDFVRGLPGVRQFCRLGSRIGFNVLTGVIDANTVYGQTDEAARSLREIGTGHMKSYLPDSFKRHKLKPLLPQRFEFQDEGCIRDRPGQRCFLAGEIRVNEQLILSTMHLTWFREHNRICDRLRQINPHWDDERLYQESRRIVVACIQHITFNEFLPMVLGKRVMREHGLILSERGYWNGYSEAEDPSITLGFMTAAYRFGHSLLPSVVERWSPSHKYIGERNLADLIRRPYDLYKAGAVDEYLLGQINQPAMAMDFAITEEVTNMLFRQPHQDHGIDLVALNLQRAREMGVPGYMHYRRWCGLSTTDSFHELNKFVSNNTAVKYARLYKSPWDIDLFSGGVAERPLPHSMVGSTFACIIATQLHRARHGDRFWYENGHQPSSFTPEQLQQIRNVQLSRVLCDNTDRIKTIQVYPLVLPDYKSNPRVACDSGVLPGLDLTYWKEG